eukprot:780542_1
MQDPQNIELQIFGSNPPPSNTFEEEFKTARSNDTTTNTFQFEEEKEIELRIKQSNDTVLPVQPLQTEIRTTDRSHCPKQHELIYFKTSERHFVHCDGCNKRIMPLSTMHTCTLCDYALKLCDECHHPKCPKQHDLHKVRHRSARRGRRCYDCRENIDSKIIYTCEHDTYDDLQCCYSHEYALCEACHLIHFNCSQHPHHGLTSFKTHERYFHCDRCNESVIPHDAMYGCRLCDYDLCEDCYDGIPDPRTTINDKTLQLRHIHYTLNEDETEIIVKEVNEPPINHTPTNISTYFQYLEEFMMDHRTQRYYLTFAPIYVICVLFCAYVCLFVANRMNLGVISHVNSPPNVSMRTNVSPAALHAISSCDIAFDDIYGWFDALSFDFERQEWIDYSLSQNHIDADHIQNKVKLGLFKGDDSNSVYLYGDKQTVIKMPSGLTLLHDNYTILTVARYNGNERGTIFVSDYDTRWIFGFENENTHILYHNGYPMHEFNRTINQFKREWVLNIASPYLFRSQQETMYNNSNVYDNDTTDIHWGINSHLESDWAVAAVMLFSYPLSLPQMQCLERFMIQEYDLKSTSNESNDSYDDDDDDAKTQRIPECDRWLKSESVDDGIVGWYDVSNGFNATSNILYDFSKHSNHILLDDHIKIGVDELNNDFRYLYGTTTDQISIPYTMHVSDKETNDRQPSGDEDGDPFDGAADSVYRGPSMSVHFVARYNGNNKGTIVSDERNDFRCGFYNGSSGVCYWSGWGPSSYGPTNYDAYGEEWVLSSVHRVGCHVIYCGQNCDTYNDDNEYCDSTINPSLTLHINEKQTSDWALSELIMIRFSKDKDTPRFHPFIETMCIEEYLSNKYNIDSYRYTPEMIWSGFIFTDLLILGAIIISGLLCCCGVCCDDDMVCGYRFCPKICGDFGTQLYQIMCFHCYCGSRNCCFLWIQSGGTCFTDCLCVCVRGPVWRHCCVCKLITFPIYNLFSGLYSIISIWRRCSFSRKYLIVYYLLNGCLILLATIIHFIFINAYIIGDTKTFDDYSLFYFLEFEICIFLWCIMLMDAIRNSKNTYNIYLILVTMVYAYLILLLCITIKTYYGDIAWTLQTSIYILSGVQCIFILVVVCTYYYSQTYIDYTLFITRSMLLILLLIVVTVDGWNDVYKIWMFSMLLTHYMNLHLADFVTPSSIASNEYQSLALKNRYVFQAMISNAKYANIDVSKLEREMSMSKAECLTLYSEVMDGWSWPYAGACIQACLMCIDLIVVSIKAEQCLRSSIDDDVQTHVQTNSFLKMNIRCKDDHKVDLLFRLLHLVVKDKLIANDKLVPHANIVTNHITLKHEYQSNNAFSIDVRLYNMIQNQSQYYQSKAQNQYFDIEDMMIILMFVKLPFFRLLFNQYLLSSNTDFIHLNRKICFMDWKLSIKVERKTGYSVLNSQIAVSSSNGTSTPIIFCQNSAELSHFVSETHNNSHGVMFRVTVCGKFAPISFLDESETNDYSSEIYIVLVPESMEIILDGKEVAQMRRGVLTFDDATYTDLKQTLNGKHLFTNDIPILANLFTLYPKRIQAVLSELKNETYSLKSLSELLIKLNDIDAMTQLFFYIKTMEYHTTLDIEVETRTGYTVFNSQNMFSEDSAMSTPIIFSDNINQMIQFVTQTHNDSQGFMFRVVVYGKFAPISFLGEDFRDMCMVVVPLSMKIISDAKEKAQMLRDVLKLDDAMEDASSDNLKQILHRANLKHLFTNHPDILTNLLILFRGHDIENSELKLLSELLIKLDDIDIMTRVLFHIKTMGINMKALFGLIWLEFIKLDHQMDVLKMRKICHEYQKEQCVGQILLEYKTSAIFERVPFGIKQFIDWEQHIAHYLSHNLPKINDHAQIPAAEEKRKSLNERVEQCVDIMQRYDDIINNGGNNDEEESKYDGLNVVELQSLFTFIDEEIGISQLMDTVFDLGTQNTKHLDTIKKQYACTRRHYCNILKSTVKTRSYGLRSRIPNQPRVRGRHGFDDHCDGVYTLSTHDFCVMELLDSVHLKLFHSEEEYRQKLPNRSGTVAEQLAKSDDVDHDDKHEDKSDDALFIDCLVQNQQLQMFCADNEYDSDAIYNDIVAMDADGICYKNIYSFFKKNAMEMKEYNILKEELSVYIIKPPDQAEQNRDKAHLLDLDFGTDVTEWNVIPRFLNSKREWLENTFAPIGKDFYESLHEQSIIIAAQDRNTTTYNLCDDELLRIKMYTDTTNLQSEYRKAFRSRSKNERREQFVHWAIDLNILFLKIEVLNIAYEYNKHIANTTLYHGLDRLFNTQGLVRRFYGALSTTPQLSVAVGFAGASGMILQINQSVNFKNARAISVRWISRFVQEEEVLLMNPQVIIQQSYVFSKEMAKKIDYLKKTLVSTVIDGDDAWSFKDLSAFLQSPWVQSCLEGMVRDKAFMETIGLFLVRECLNGMTFLEFIFFECQQYHFATYVHTHGYMDEKEIFQVLIGRDLFMNDDNQVSSVDRSERWCSQRGYQPLMCTMTITYQYSKTHKIMKEFGTRDGKQMLRNTDLILQYVDQRKLNTFQKGLTVSIDMKIKYQQRANGTKCRVRKWRYTLNNYVALEIKRNFNWMIKKSTNLTLGELCISSLWISDNSVVTHHVEDNADEKEIYDACARGTLRIYCTETVRIDEGCSISMNGCGIKGAEYDKGTKRCVYPISVPYTTSTGRCGVTCGGGGGFTQQGGNGLTNGEIDAYGGDKYLTHEVMENDRDPIRFSVGFGGGCGDLIGSRGGNGGGKIYILCNNLEVNDGGMITANGDEGVNCGGGGSGGSIVVTANRICSGCENRLLALGGRGDNKGGNGSCGIVQFGVIEGSNLKFVDTFENNYAQEIAMYGVMNAFQFD